MTQRSRLCESFAPLLLAASALLGASAAQAQSTSFSPDPEPNVVEDRFRVELNVLFASIDTQLRIDQSLTQQGTLVDAEDDLGLDDSALMPQAEITLLPGKRHLFRLGGFSSRRSASTIIEEEIVFDDEVYLPGERVDSEIDLTLFGLTYGYRLLVMDRAELTVTLGVQIASVDVNALVRSRVVREAETGTAPLPMLGLEGRYDFTQRWSAEARVQYLTANVDEVDGTMLDARLAVTWRMNPHLVFGVGYRSFEVDIDSRSPSDPGIVNMSISGPLLFARASL